MKAREAHEMSLLAGHEGNVAQEIRLSDMIGRDNSVFELWFSGMDMRLFIWRRNECLQE